MTDVSLRYLLFGEDRSASKSIKNVESSATKSGKAIGSSFASMGSAIGGEVGDMISRVGEGITSLSESAKGMAPKLAAGGAAATGLGAALSMLGSKDKEAQNQLQASIEATGNSMSDYREEIEKTIKSQENYGHTASDTQTALSTLTLAFNDPKKAMEQMGLVADLAAAKHIGLADAAVIVAKTAGGSTKALKQFGVTALSSAQASKTLTSAESKHHAAVTELTKAEKALADLRAVDAGKKKLSTAEEIKLKDAQIAVTKAQEKAKGTQGALTAAQADASKAGKHNEEVLSALSVKLKGQAAASVDSFAGRLDVMKTKLEDAASQFGNKFGPALQVGGVAMMGFAAALEVGNKLALGTRIQMGLLSAQTLAQSAVSKTAAAAQWLLNVAMEANPIGLIVAALAGLIAVFVLLYKHSTTFRNAMNAAFHAVVGAAQWAFNWIKSNWPLILAILTGPFGIAVLLIVKNWSKISAAAGTAVTFIKGIWNGFMSFLGGIGSKIGSIAGSMWSGVGNAFRSVINGIIDIWNRLHFSIPSVHLFGKTLGGGTIGVPQIPHMATGGFLTSAGAAVVGEHGREILDFPAGARVRPLSAMDTRGNAAGGDTYTFNVAGALDPHAVARQIEQLLTQLKRTSGRKTLAFQ